MLEVRYYTVVGVYLSNIIKFVIKNQWKTRIETKELLKTESSLEAEMPAIQALTGQWWKATGSVPNAERPLPNSLLSRQATGRFSAGTATATSGLPEETFVGKN
ncbi:MAG: hypothetical protein UU96_C0025G0002 [Parcubacteria group bacterium GW2011_GWC2_42_13]|nr:MAG: hypothetical protein UU96_C0025G0002 [Parcubacteria group bacterium GW2011_GWC2_42_13]